MLIKKYVVIGPVILLLIWFIVSLSGVIDSFFLPSPISTIQELVKLISTGAIIPDTFITLERVIIAFILALIIGLPAGLILGSTPKIYESVEFVIEFFRSIPATAMFPLFMLVFGISDSSKIAVATFASILIILFNTAYGVRHSKKLRALTAKLMGASKIQIFRFVSFWESLPQTIAGMRLAVSLSLIIIIVTEMFIGTTVGLGRLIIDFQYTYDIPGMYAIILLVGVIGYLINIVFIIAEKKFIRWTGS
jgi:NitT/TauT family transport system permease protein